MIDQKRCQLRKQKLVLSDAGKQVFKKNWSGNVLASMYINSLHSQGKLVLINMFKLHFVIATCIVAVVVAIPIAIKTLESIESEGKSIKNVEKVKTSLKSLFESIKYQADSSRASDDTENVTSKAEDVSDIGKVDKCWQQNVAERSDSKIYAIVEKFRKISGDIEKMNNCKESKDEEECLKTTIGFMKQDIRDFLTKTEPLIQWMLNDALPDFYSCVLKK
nr:unnamed protein product [Callosobruchus analis]